MRTTPQSTLLYHEPEPTSLIIHQRHPGLNCTAATVEPSARCLWFLPPLPKYNLQPDVVARSSSVGFTSLGTFTNKQTRLTREKVNVGGSEMFFRSSRPKKLIIALLFMVLDCLL